MTSKRKHFMLIPTYAGAALGFISYLFVGAVPGLLYGGYMGLAMSSVLFGSPVEATLAAKLVTFGGMFLGLAASFFFFLVMGSLFGTAVGLPFAAPLRRLAGVPSAKARMRRAAAVRRGSAR